MAEQRVIIEMGQGVSQYGQDHTKAAARAIDDAIRHSSLPLIRALDIPETDMRVQVTVGVPDPDAVDTDALVKVLPHGQVTVRAERGGLRVTNPDTGQEMIMAAAAVEVFLPPQIGWRLR